jgi:hypothetical protein
MLSGALFLHSKTERSVIYLNQSYLTKEGAFHGSEASDPTDSDPIPTHDTIC